MLIRGASGAGKSTLVLACLHAGFRLVADDRVVVWRSGDSLFGRAPDALSGLLEVRGVGVVPAGSSLGYVPVSMVIDLSDTVERMPEPDRITLETVAVPRVDFLPTAPQAPLRLAAALAAMQHGL